MRRSLIGFGLLLLWVVGCQSTSNLFHGPRRCDESWDLGRASYSAHWVTEKSIVIIAEGDKPGSAYDVCLGVQNIKIYPPRYELRWKSKGMGTAQMTHFKVEERFNVGRDQTTVHVKDADGDHEVPIKDR